MVDSGNNNFTVILEWSQYSGETYSIASDPKTLHTNFTTNTSVQLVMLYNIQYNLTVTATLCGNRNAINFTTLNYYHSKNMHNNKCIFIGLIISP